MLVTIEGWRSAINTRDAELAYRDAILEIGSRTL
jgi:hypothetical protein